MGVETTGGFGADVKLTEKSAYTIKIKIAAEKDRVVDSFTHKIDWRSTRKSSTYRVRNEFEGKYKTHR